jgi:uncharacterized repeat protein (TIGR01451 family)
MNLTNRLNVLGIALMLALCATPALANHVDTANVNASCNGYSISLAASSLTPGDFYTIYWTIDIDGVAAVNNEFYEFDASAPTQTATLSRTWSQYGITLTTGNHTFTGQAVLVGVTQNQTFNTLQITFSPTTLSCPTKPQLKVTKTPDKATVTPGSLAGFTVTISNPGAAAATGVKLTDPLPGGAGSDIYWTIDTTKGNPADFTITGAVGSQMLTLDPSSGITLNAGASLTVHITGPTTVNDAQPGGASPSLNLGTDSNYIFIDTGATKLGWNAYQLDGNVLFVRRLDDQH